MRARLFLFGCTAFAVFDMQTKNRKRPYRIAAADTDSCCCKRVKSIKSSSIELTVHARTTECVVTELLRSNVVAGSHLEPWILSSDRPREIRRNMLRHSTPTSSFYEDTATSRPPLTAPQLKPLQGVKGPGKAHSNHPAAKIQSNIAPLFEVPHCNSLFFWQNSCAFFTCSSRI
ncbi:hypothetical protein Pla22_05500 [Rubripirellula amarantea]|uniref:Uncharacterized protein n=1 Tax=Rubripirellula amarantea TaxID=2527999 RepID=A0A5C5WSY0_9BACT|nr:hypothetical protein Pla22_05500 [Rubripirellula amarantea]